MKTTTRPTADQVWESMRDHMTASFRRDTGKRKGDAFFEDQDWWVIDADGHQWCYTDDAEWVCFTEDDDEYVQQVRREKRSRRAAWR